MNSPTIPFHRPATAAFTPTPESTPEPKVNRHPVSLFTVIASSMCAAIMASALTVIAMTKFGAQNQPTHAPRTVPTVQTPGKIGATSAAEVFIAQTESRIKKLATIEANTLIRLQQAEESLSTLQADQRALARAKQDLSLRVETLSKDFTRMPDTQFSDPGLP